MLKNVKITTIISPLDLLAPHSCMGCGRIGSILCDRCKNYLKNQPTPNLCPICKHELKNHRCDRCEDLPEIYYVGEKSGLLSEMVKEYKYHSVRALAKPLAELLSSRLPEDLNNKNVVLVPLPTATNHLRSRGFDHIGLLSKRLAFSRHFRVEPLLVRTKNTVQVGADGETRKLQAESAYAVKKDAKFDDGALYLLLDDVWTTGASMQAAIKKLRDAGAKNLAAAVLVVNRLS